MSFYNKTIEQNIQNMGALRVHTVEVSLQFFFRYNAYIYSWKKNWFRRYLEPTDELRAKWICASWSSPENPKSQVNNLHFWVIADQFALLNPYAKDQILFNYLGFGIGQASLLHNTWPYPTDMSNSMDTCMQFLNNNCEQNEVHQGGQHFLEPHLPKTFFHYTIHS